MTDLEVDDEYQFERRWYGSNPEQLQRLAEWFIEQQVEEVVMESTAQYWKPVWSALEQDHEKPCDFRVLQVTDQFFAQHKCRKKNEHRRRIQIEV